MKSSLPMLYNLDVRRSQLKPIKSGGMYTIDLNRRGSSHHRYCFENISIPKAVLKYRYESPTLRDNYPQLPKINKSSCFDSFFNPEQAMLHTLDYSSVGPSLPVQPQLPWKKIETMLSSVEWKQKQLREQISRALGQLVDLKRNYLFQIDSGEKEAVRGLQRLRNTLKSNSQVMELQISNNLLAIEHELIQVQSYRTIAIGFQGRITAVRK